MRRYLGAVTLLMLTASLGAIAQADNPELVSANIPYYPPLARQARVYGTVRVAFTLLANSGEPVQVEAVSGHPMLESAAVENVKTWRFRNAYAIGRKYETTINYVLTESERRHVTFEPFNVVDIISPKPPPLDSN
jgi:TonB family protein